jgi:hypothetical protein
MENVSIEFGAPYREVWACDVMSDLPLKAGVSQYESDPLNSYSYQVRLKSSFLDLLP